MNLHARTEWCPNGCSYTQKLIRKNLSETHAIKGCKLCKRKFTFIRTDTKQGRALRAREWRKEKFPVVEPKPTTEPLTGAERMRRLRARQKEALALIEQHEAGQVVDLDKVATIANMGVLPDWDVKTGVEAKEDIDKARKEINATDVF